MKQYTDKELQEMYDEMLDDVYPKCKIGGYTYSTSQCLKIIDEPAYDEGFNDWLDGEIRDGNIFEKDDCYYDSDPEDYEDEDNA